MIQIDKKLIQELFDKAVVSERKRMNYDLRTSSEDSSQRMLNALLPGTCVPVHRHPMSNENVLLLCGKIVEVLYNVRSTSSGTSLVEVERYMLDPSVGNFGCVVPANVWHTVEVYEPSVIFEAKDGRYGEDRSETFEEFQKVFLRQAQDRRQFQEVSKGTIPDNCIGDLKQQITYLIGMERHSGSMEVITPLYVSRMLNVPLEKVEAVMKEMEL